MALSYTQIDAFVVLTVFVCACAAFEALRARYGWEE